MVLRNSSRSKRSWATTLPVRRRCTQKRADRPSFLFGEIMFPLEGIRVVSLEQAVAAPMCTRRLVLAGAEVIKVERPEGDFARHYDTAVAGQSAYFVWLNAGKKSVVMDLRLREDVDRLRKLISMSDVLVQNLKPGAMAKLGLDLETLHTDNPRLVSVSISGFHPDTPGADRKAYDLLMQAESGLASITGSSQEPGRVGVSLVDLATGMYAYEAVLEALLARARTGQGEPLHVALFDSVSDWMAVPHLLHEFTGEAPARVGLAHPGICPYGVFSSADGVEFVLSIQNEREWQRLCGTGVKLPDLAADPRCTDNETRVQNRPFVDGAIAEVFLSMAYTDIDRQLAEADLAYAPVNPVADLGRHPGFRTAPVAVNGESIQLPVVPGRQRPGNLRVPDLGEHTQEVHQLLGE